MRNVNTITAVTKSIAFACDGGAEQNRSRM